MREIELKLVLDAAQEKRLRAAPALKALSEGKARTETLHSIYYDTPDQTLRRAGIALRLRKVGRRWVQTAKRATKPMVRGLSTPIEDERPAPGGKLAPELIADDDLRERIVGAAQAGLQPTVETRFRRTKRVLRTPSGGRVEFALDVGDLIGAGRAQPFIEAELELLDGSPAELYGVAADLLGTGPLRFSDHSKSERAARLLNGAADTPLAARRAGPVEVMADISVEAAAGRILDEALAHFLPNVVLTVETDDPDGPHQTRVALRRMRSALGAFRKVLGAEAVRPWSAAAREIGAEVGRLRDLDVLIDEMLAPAAAASPDPGFATLLDAMATRRTAVRDDLRAYLAGPEVLRFGLGFAAFLAGRGWLDPADHDQTGRLAQPLGPFARRVLDARWKAVARYGRRIAKLTIEERHEMRKELKKLRYLVEALRGLYSEARVVRFLRQLKALQESFGALNDAAMAEAVLIGPDAPAAGDVAAARAAGRVLGRLDGEAARLWPQAAAGWKTLTKTPKFWR